MINNSTLLFIIDEPNNKSEIINITSLLDLEDACITELDTIFRVFDYTPSDEVIDRILMHV